MNRREFIGGTAAALSAHSSLVQAGSSKLRILILGGTKFIGIHMTQLLTAWSQEAKS